MRGTRHLLAATAIAVSAVAFTEAGTASADHRFAVTGTFLTGAQEVDDGDPDGFGVAGVTINVHRERICYALAVKRIEPATAAHIHRGGVGTNGPVEVTLDAPSDGFSAGCVPVGRQLAEEIANDPSGFYINVHNAEFQPGAVRGQLH